MKKNNLIPILLCLICVLLLCACSDVTVEISGIPMEEPSKESYSFSLAGSTELGSAYSESLDGVYTEGDEITAHAVPAEDKAFFCWTAGGTLEDGGTFVSYDKDYTFSIGENTELYPNFRSHDTALVLYHMNGGYALREDVDADPDTFWNEFSLAYYLYPNSLPEMGYFARDGYTLVGYNTEPDESGDFFNIGGKVFVDTDAVIELYCVWRENSPVEDFGFEYDTTYGGWAVNAYNGSAEDVCIPSTYSGQPVVGVAEGAFTGNETIVNLVFPSCIRYISDYSCNNMTNLTAILMFDSLLYLSDASFDGDEALYTCFFSAATNPHYSTWFNNHTKKIEIMNYWKDSDRPLMIILGGSSTTYAVDAQQLESLLDRDYLVLNCGSNGANLFNMTSEWAMHFLREDDFLLQIIEYSYWQLGGIQCRWETFRSFESCYNIFSWVRVSKYDKFFDSFNEYLSERAKQDESTYESYVGTIAPQGYYDIQGTLKVATTPNGSNTYWHGRRIGFYAYKTDGTPWLYDFMVYYCNVQYWKLDELGVDYAMAFTPLNRNSLYDWQTDWMMDYWKAYLEENLNIDIISDIHEHILDPEIFFDDDYHVAAPGRADYTANLAEDLNTYFASLDSAEE